MVIAEWDFVGAGNYPNPATVSPIRPEVYLDATFTYYSPGTYFPVLRATSQREGDPDTPFARIDNIGRVRVVVH